MNAPTVLARLDTLRERRQKIDAEIIELEDILGIRRLRRSRRDVPPCGTEQGYQRHIYRRRKHGEGEPCDDCRKAHARHNRDRWEA